jgi:hypothetical protein
VADAGDTQPCAKRIGLIEAPWQGNGVHGASWRHWLTALPGLGLAAEEEGVGSCDGIQRLAGLAVLVRVWGAVVLSNTATD